MSGDQQQQAPTEQQNAITAAAGRFRDVVGNLLKEVGSCVCTALMRVAAMSPLVESAFVCCLALLAIDISHLQRKPWSELLDRTAFSRPENFAEVNKFSYILGILEKSLNALSLDEREESLQQLDVLYNTALTDIK